MAQYYYVKIESGGNSGPYSIYYDEVNINKYAKLLYQNNVNATNLTFEQMKGIWVEVPNTATEIIVINDNVNCNNYNYEFELRDPYNNLGGGQLTLNSEGNNTIIETNKIVTLKKNSYNNSISYIVPKSDYVVDKIEYKNQNNEIISVPFTKLPNENKYSTGILMNHNGSSQSPKFTVYFKLEQGNVTKITNVVTDCLNSTITINITGGTTTHQYSVDSGVTFSTSTTQKTFTKTFDNTNPINIIVKDENGSLIKWNEIKCNNIKLTMIPIYLNCGSDGEIQYINGNITEETNIIGQKDDTLTFTAIAGTNNTFVGWSKFYYNKSFLPYLPFSTNTEYLHTFTNDEVIYGIFFNNTVICMEFCVYETSNGYELTNQQCNDFCKSCPKKVTLYFNKTQYTNNNGDFTQIDWYIDETLTTKVDYGYYKLNDNKILPQIFIVNNGSATPDCSCDGENLIC